MVALTALPAISSVFHLSAVEVNWLLPLLLLLLVALLLGLLWWRFNGGKGDQPAPVASSNHKSVRSFHYAPKPILEPAVAAPPLSTDNPLLHLMPEEDLRAREEQEIQAEADRIKAGQIAARELETAEPAAEPVPHELAKVPVVDEPVAEPATSAPQAVSSVHALGAGAVSVFDMLGTNDLPTTPSPAPVASSDEVAPDPALFYNPFSAVAPTANDEANQQTVVELRRRQRAAIKAKSAEQIAALSTLYQK